MKIRLLGVDKDVEISNEGDRIEIEIDGEVASVEYDELKKAVAALE